MSYIGKLPATEVQNSVVDLATGETVGILPVSKGGTGVTAATYCSLTANVSGTLPVSNGGTGAFTLAANNVILGNGTSAVQTVAPGTSGNVLTSNGTTWVSSAAAGGGGSTLTNDTTTNATQYIGMSRSISGAWTAAYVADSELYFNPSTGTLFSVQFQSLSDEKVKTNVETIAGAVDTVKSLRGVEFDWRDSGLRSSGVIAQEIERVLPHLVTEENGVKSVNYMGVIGYLIEAVKELSDKLEK